MKFLGMGMPELVIILVVILIIFGPKNLPKLGASLGKAVKGVREGVDSVNSELDAVKESVDDAGNDKKKSTKESEEAQKAETPITATATVEDVPAETATGAEATGAAAFCSQCGAALGADSKFCNKCGAATN